MDKLKVTILEDGTIKLETDEVSAANHLNAEQFLKLVASLAGGAETVEHKHDHAHHEHGHTQSHGH